MSEQEASMTQPTPRTGPRHEPERVYERADDPAEASDRPLEPKTPGDPLHDADEPDPTVAGPERDDPHHRLNTRVGTPDPAADSDPYRTSDDEEDESDRASGTSGAHQGAEQR
jgi:hypothetical protein